MVYFKTERAKSYFFDELFDIPLSGKYSLEKDMANKNLNTETNFEISEDGILTKYTGPGGKVVIPEKICDIPVRVIGDSAFFGNELTSIVIPESVTEIGAFAFRYNNLTSVVIPESVTKIGDHSFRHNILKEIAIPGNVTEIGSCAFYGNQLTGLIIPESVTKIANMAFFGNRLTEITIPNSIKIISEHTFAKNKISNIIFSENITEIDSCAFYGNELTKLVIPESVTRIGGRAFSNNKLIELMLPKTVARIGDRAFANNQLNSITIYGKLTLFRKSEYTASSFDNDFNGFYEENGKRLGTYSFDGKVWSVGNILSENGFKIDEKGTLINYTGTDVDLVIPMEIANITVRLIGRAAFLRKDISSVVIPECVTEIAYGAFAENQLTELVIPKGVKKIGELAFRDNPLNSITVGANVKLDRSFDNRFGIFYTRNDKVAGTYLFNGEKWNLKNDEDEEEEVKKEEN